MSYIMSNHVKSCLSCLIQVWYLAGIQWCMCTRMKATSRTDATSATSLVHNTSATSLVHILSATPVVYIMSAVLLHPAQPWPIPPVRHTVSGAMLQVTEASSSPVRGSFYYVFSEENWVYPKVLNRVKYCFMRDYFLSTSMTLWSSDYDHKNHAKKINW